MLIPLMSTKISQLRFIVVYKLLMDCCQHVKSSLFDIILPLIAYLAFFCGLMELLIISGAAERLATKLSPAFAKVFPSVPKKP